MQRFSMILALTILSLSSAVYAADKPYVSGRYLSSEMAIKAVTASLAHCTKLGYQVSVALVDRGGNLQALSRNPLSGSHTINVSIAKAQTSATFQADTMQLMLDKNMQPLRHASGVLLLGGGLPIRIGGQFYGGIGVSGAPAKKQTGDIDEECAKAGIDAIREDVEFAE